MWHNLTFIIEILSLRTPHFITPAALGKLSQFSHLGIYFLKSPPVCSIELLRHSKQTLPTGEVVLPRPKQQIIGELVICVIQSEL